MTDGEATIVLTKLFDLYPQMTEGMRAEAALALMPFAVSHATEAVRVMAADHKWFALSDFLAALRRVSGQKVKSPASEAAERQRREYAVYRERMATEAEAYVKSPDQLRWEREFMAMTDQQQAAYIGAALDFMGTPSKQRARYEARSVEDWLARPAILQAYAVELRRLSRQGGVL